MDLVYIVGKSSYNFDLLYSLRSVDEHVTGFDQVFIVGYKPHFVSGVGYIPTKQTGSKWQNGLGNIIAACRDPRVSEDFVLMNDDFFALRGVDVRKDLKYNAGPLAEIVAKYKEKKPSLWQQALIDALGILKDVKNPKSYALHIPMVINKVKALEMLEREDVRALMDAGKVVSFRSLYGNLYPARTRRMDDVKIPRTEDLTDKWSGGQWISTYDGMVRNARYRRLNAWIKSLPKSARFEA